MFNNPFSFAGRINRTEYALTFLIYMVAYLFELMLLESEDPKLALTGVLLVIPLVWFIWAQGAKRCHDFGNSGWFQIIPFYFVYMLLKKGDAGGNQYDISTNSDARK